MYFQSVFGLLSWDAASSFDSSQLLLKANFHEATNKQTGQTWTEHKAAKECSQNHKIIFNACGFSAKLVQFLLIHLSFLFLNLD